MEGYTLTLSLSVGGASSKIILFFANHNLDFKDPDLDLICSIEHIDRPTRASRSTIRSRVGNFKDFVEYVSKLDPNERYRAWLFFQAGHHLPDLEQFQGRIPWDAFQVGLDRVPGSRRYEYIATYNPLLSPEITWLPLATNAMHRIIVGSRTT